MNLNVALQLTNQRQIIVSSFGFTNLQTTLLGAVSPSLYIEILTVPDRKVAWMVRSKVSSVTMIDSIHW